jgi:hypothetical protein
VGTTIGAGCDKCRDTRPPLEICLTCYTIYDLDYAKDVIEMLDKMALDFYLDWRQACRDRDLAISQRDAAIEQLERIGRKAFWAAKGKG